MLQTHFRHAAFCQYSHLRYLLVTGLTCSYQETTDSASEANLTSQVVARNFSEKFVIGGVVGLLGMDSLTVGALAVANASIGLVTEASVNLTGASCDGIFVSGPLSPPECPCS